MPVDVIVLYGAPANPAAFDRHYRETHVPLVHALPGLVSFEWSRGAVDVQGGPDCHLVARMRWADRAALEASLGSPAGAAAVADLGSFADGGATILTADVGSA